MGQHQNLKRTDFDKLLMNKLPNVLNEAQKKNKIGNLLKQLRMDKKIYADNHRVWHLSKE